MASTLRENGGIVKTNLTECLSEAVHVISCGYEDKTEWGKEVCFVKIIYIYILTKSSIIV